MSEMLAEKTMQNGLVDEVRRKEIEEAHRMYASMTDDEKAEIDQFIPQLDITNSQHVRNFGAKLESVNGTYCDEFLNRATKGSYEERQVKNTLSKLIDEVEKKSPTDEGFFGKLIFSVEQQKKKMVRKVQTVSEIIDDIEGELHNVQADTVNNITDIEELGRNLLEHMKGIQKFIIAGELALEQFLENEGARCDERMKVASESEKLIIRREFEEQHKEFLSRLNDLRTLQNLSMVSALQLMEMKKENTLLYDSIHKAITYTIPIWKQQCSIALIQKRTEKAANANISIKRATEKMLQDNVAAINAGLVEATKDAQEGFFNPDVLIKVTDEIKKTLTDVQKIEAEGFKKQAERTKKLAQGRDALIALATTLDRESQLSELMRLKSSEISGMAEIDVNTDNKKITSSNQPVYVRTELEI